jgi:hypothetical protein
VGRGENKTAKGAIVLAFQIVVVMEIFRRGDGKKGQQGDDGKAEKMFSEKIHARVNPLVAFIIEKVD